MRVLKKEVWPFDIEIRVAPGSEYSNDLENWCNGVFGKRFQNWYSYNTNIGLRKYAFKTEADLLVFKLRGK